MLPSAAPGAERHHTRFSFSHLERSVLPADAQAVGERMRPRKVNLPGQWASLHLAGDCNPAVGFHAAAAVVLIADHVRLTEEIQQAVHEMTPADDQDSASGRGAHEVVAGDRLPA